MELTNEGSKAVVCEASSAKPKAPSTFEGSTTAQSLMVFQNCRLSVRTSATGIKRVLREELRTADDNHDKAERVEHPRDHPCVSGCRPSKASAMAVASADKPMNAPAPKPESASAIEERSNSWRALVATCS